MKDDFKIPRGLYIKCRELLGIVISSKYPADNEISCFFRKNKNSGKRDRKFIAETVYGILRNYKFLDFVIKKTGLTRGNFCDRMILAYMIKFENKTPEEIKNISGIFIEHDISEKIIKFQIDDANDIEKIGLQYSVPDWFVKIINEEYDIGSAKLICQGLNSEAQLTIRTNTAFISRQNLQNMLEKEGIKTEITRFSPVGLVVSKKTNLFEYESFKKGYYEVQDEGSQIISYLTAAAPGEIIVDGCCGAGGKTLHISDLMKNKGILYAFDISENRVKNLRKRVKKCRLDNIRIQVLSEENKFKISRLNGKVNKVLVDAPCSGSGVFRRNPDAKLKLKEEEVKIVFPDKQYNILNKYAPLLKPNGFLIYSTCSVAHYENEKVVSKFLYNHNDFELMNVSEILLKYGINLNMNTVFLKLYPHIHSTDGFFSAVIRKK